MSSSEVIQTKEDVVKFLKDHRVSFVNLWFTDVLDQLKSFNIWESEVESALVEDRGIDGSSIEGFVRIEESD